MKIFFSFLRNNSRKLWCKFIHNIKISEIKFISLQLLIKIPLFLILFLISSFIQEGSLSSIVINLFGVKLEKTFINNLFKYWSCWWTTKSPINWIQRFSYTVHISFFIIPYQALWRRRINNSKVKLVKYYLTITFYIKRWEHATFN